MRLFMVSLLVLFDQIASRIAQGVSLLLTCLFLPDPVLLALASYRLAGMQQRWAPIIIGALKQVLGRDVHLGQSGSADWIPFWSRMPPSHEVVRFRKAPHFTRQR